MTKRRKNNVKLAVLCIAVFGIIGAFLYSHFNISENEKAVFRYWYLHNIGKKAAIDDTSSGQPMFILPQSGIDINCSGISQLLKFASAPTPSVIALLDTGVDFSQNKSLNTFLWTNYQEIAVNRTDDDHNGYTDDVHGYNFVQNMGDTAFYQTAAAENDHGTICAGIMCSIIKEAIVYNEEIQKPTNIPVQIMPLKVMERNEDTIQGADTAIVAAIHYAEENGAKVCNLSFSMPDYSEDLYHAMKTSSMLFVVSAGNGAGRGTNIDQDPSYPASFDLDNMISVANLNYNGNLNKNSNYGVFSVDIAAPGTSIYSMAANGDYRYSTGTSAAAPMVSTVAGFLFTLNPQLSPQEVIDILLDTAMPLPDLRQKTVCGGMLDTENAMSKTLDRLK